MSIDLKNLVGIHMLDAVDFTEETVESCGCQEDASVCRFRIDGVTYVAAEDPEDGYRSCMAGLLRDDATSLTNVFEPVEVLARYVDQDDDWGYQCDILQFFDTTTGKLVLEVGTHNTDDYYPNYVANFKPENMAINQ